MQSLWNDADAARFEGELGARVYTSRLLGSDASLVLHGGGNTSVKLTERDLFGESSDVLYVKGSGTSLATIDASGFTPVELRALLRLADLETLTDGEMVRRLRLATLDPAAPMPSVEAILHAVLPFRFVDHTHPDALLSVMNTPSGRRRIEELYGDETVVIPYVMPGFLLARRCALELAAGLAPRTTGVVLMHHGLVTFGETARESYERTIDLVGRAEAHLREHDAWAPTRGSAVKPAGPVRHALAHLRRDVSAAAGRPMILTSAGEPGAWTFAGREDVEAIATRGPATPDHVIRTKLVPLVGRDVDAYVSAYTRYFEAHAARREDLTMLDPAPRVVVDRELGVVAIGDSAADAAVVHDIFLHTLEAIERSELLEQWAPLPESDLFEVEYWELEQAKLRRATARPPFAGEIVLVTGAASGIGKACATDFLDGGAAVVALDRSERVKELSADSAYLGIVGDITDASAVAGALEAAARGFGGLDVLVLNAGVFPTTSPIEALALEDWRRAMEVNVDANVGLLREAFPLLREAPRGGRVVVNASKNVPAPGPGAASYSASKAALTQLARVAALEWGAYGIRVNVVHPNAVFDTGLWSEEVIGERAKSYGLTVDEYRQNNVLGVEVTSADVARTIVAMCGPAFSRTTGAQVPVDGGNERVI